ncbi:MAG: hypothetical protein LLG00_06540 [Planctomycetaceae bacterium]|nr:hypothetical protein [Planctomycetaceae bacterium]
MKIVFRTVLALSLATLLLVAPSQLRASPDAPSKNASPSEEAVNLDGQFPVNKRNPIQVSMETVTLAGDKENVRRTLVPTFVAGDKVLKEVIAHPENANAFELATAASGALRAGDLEEAGLLIFAARLRGFQDLENYPPTNNNPSVRMESLLGLVIDFVKSEVVLEKVQFEPKVLAGVVKRLESLELKEPAGYAPGWDYTKHTAKPDLFAKNKAEMLDALRPVSALLSSPDYFAAFKCYSEFNNLPSESQKQPAREKSRDQAVKTMKRIEKEKNLRGVMYQVDHAEAN